MYKVAVIKGNDVVNVVTLDDVEFLPSLEIFLPEMDDFILETEETGPAFIGGKIIGGRFAPLAPFASWVFNQADFQWQSPVPYPDSNLPHTWDEGAQEWTLVELEVIEE
jgi:hypothetical protein